MGIANRKSLSSDGSRSPDVATVRRAIGLRYRMISTYGSKSPTTRQPPVAMQRVESVASDEFSTSGSITEEPEDSLVGKPRTRWAKQTHQTDRYALAASPFTSPAAAAALQPHGERELVVPHRRPSERSRARKAKAKKIFKYALGLH